MKNEPTIASFTKSLNRAVATHAKAMAGVDMLSSTDRTALTLKSCQAVDRLSEQVRFFNSTEDRETAYELYRTAKNQVRANDEACEARVRAERDQYLQESRANREPSLTGYEKELCLMRGAL